MITVLQNNDKPVYDRIAAKWGITKDSVLLLAEEKGTTLGHVLFHLDGENAIVTGFELTDTMDYTTLDAEQLFISELLIRAVANYASNRNILRVKSTLNNLFFTAIQLKLDVSGDVVDISVVSIFNSRKCNGCC